MFYAIVCKNPFIYLSNEKEDILKLDFEFVLENPEECEMPEGFVSEEYVALTPSQFAQVLVDESIDGYIYTFVDGVLSKRKYKKALHFYANPECGIEYPTYCSNANTIRAGLLTNKELTSVVSSLVEDVFSPGSPELSLDPPTSLDEDLSDYTVLAYVCVPILMKKIPIGVETEEEREELEADIADTELQ